MTPLHQAVADGDLAAATTALDAVPIDFPDAGFRPLELAIARGRGELALWLVQRGANPNLSNAGNLTPLHRAAQRGQEAVVAALLAAGAEPNAREWDEARSALHFATLGSHPSVVAALLDADADPSFLTVTGITAVQAAAAACAVRADGPKAQRALETLTLTRTACMLGGVRGAVALGDASLLAEALAAGGDPDDACSWNVTPLMMAAALGSTGCVDVLLDAGADLGRVAWRRLPFERQRLGTASDWARQRGHTAIAERLES